MLRLNENNIKKFEDVVTQASICGVIVVFFYLVVASCLSFSGDIGNLVLYAGVILVFVITMIAISYLIIVSVDIKRMHKSDKLISFIFLIISLFFMIRFFLNESKHYDGYVPSYFRHSINAWLYGVLLIVVALIVFVLVRLKIVLNKVIRHLVAILVSFVQGLLLYVDNPFLDDYRGIFHIDAYTNSIFNSLDCAPLDMSSNSIYGHYGILYILPVKLLHSLGLTYWTSVILVISILGFVTFLVEYMIIDKLVHNDMLYIVAVIANTIVSTEVYTNQYYQVMPHRYIFPALVIYGCSIAFKKPKSLITRFLMWIIIAFSIVWNTETGIVVGVVWTAACLYLDNSIIKRLSVLKILKVLVKNMVLLIASFIGAYGIVNIYNVIGKGSFISLRTFMYPIGSENTYSIKGLQVPVPDPTYSYFVVIVIMLITVGALSIRYIFSSLNERQFIVFLNSVMSVGLYVYFMNRPYESNATIVCFQVVTILAYFCDVIMEKEGNVKGVKDIFMGCFRCVDIKRISAVLALIILSAMMIESIASFPHTYVNKKQTTWNNMKLDEFVKDIDKKTPDDTVAFGYYTAQLYGMIDRKTGIYISDWEDIAHNTEALTKVQSLLESADYEHILIHSDIVEILKDKVSFLDDYNEIDSISYNDYAKSDKLIEDYRFNIYEKKK